MNEHAFPIRYFLPAKFQNASSNCLSHNNPANEWPYNQCFLWFCAFVVEDVSKRLDIVIWEFWAILEHPPIFTWVYADIASTVCPSQPDKFAVTSMIFCSSHQWRRWALFSEDCVGSRIVLYSVSSENDVPFIRLYFEVTFSVSLCFQNNLLWCFPNPMLELSRAFSIPCPRFCIRNLHCLWHRDELVHLIITCHGSKSFSDNAIFMHFWTAKVLPVVSWVHEIPLDNRILFWRPFDCQSSAFYSPSRW